MSHSLYLYIIQSISRPIKNQIRNFTASDWSKQKIQDFSIFSIFSSLRLPDFLRNEVVRTATTTPINKSIPIMENTEIPFPVLRSKFTSSESFNFFG